MNDLKFLKGSAEQYRTLDSKVETTFYYTTDDGKLYLGTHELTTEAEVTAAVAKVTTHETEIEKLKKEISTLIGSEDGKSIHDLIEEAVNNENTNYVGAKDSLTTDAQTTIVAAINEVDAHADAAQAAADKAKTDSVVTIEKDDKAEGVAVKYTIKQGGAALEQTIDIPKDMVVSSGEVVVVTAEDILPDGTYYNKVDKAGTYIKLTLANAEKSELFILVDTLVDIYNGATDGEKTKEIKVTVDNTSREISATIQAGAIVAEKIATGAVTTEKIANSAVDGTKLAENAVTEGKIAENAVTEATIAANAITTDKIKDANVTTAKLEESIVTSLGKADSALQEASIAEGTSNGTIKVNENEVHVHGLKDLAYKNQVDLGLDNYLTADDITGETETNGAISVKGTDVNVHGLKSLAYMDEDELSLTEYAKKADIKEGATDGTIAVGETNVKVHNLANMIKAGAETVVNEKLTWGTIAAE